MMEKNIKIVNISVFGLIDCCNHAGVSLLRSIRMMHTREFLQISLISKNFICTTDFLFVCIFQTICSILAELHVLLAGSLKYN